jgi:hypothetical protein
LSCWCSFTDKGTLALAAEKLTLERALRDLVNQANGLTPAENVELVSARF